ncbi:MAG: nucleotidyltransferase family protein [Gemmata sp.]|nr:nucleotidyltransferase family protein [Gemmata sp.]
MIVALIPAAGFSRRMGCPKLSLPWAGRTILEHVIAACRTGGATRVLVVVGRHVLELARLAAAAGADVCRLPGPTADMRATVECGFTWIEQNITVQPLAWLLVPADHPLVEPAVVQQLIASFHEQPAFSIFLPTFRGQRGHPVLLAWRHVAGIRNWPHDSGINRYIRHCAAECWEVPVASESVVWDLDTPDDYQRLLSWPVHESSSRQAVD